MKTKKIITVITIVLVIIVTNILTSCNNDKNHKLVVGNWKIKSITPTDSTSSTGMAILAFAVAASHVDSVEIKFTNTDTYLVNNKLEGEFIIKDNYLYLMKGGDTTSKLTFTFINDKELLLTDLKEKVKEVLTKQ